MIFILLGLSVAGVGAGAISHAEEFFPVLSIVIGVLLLPAGIILVVTFFKNQITEEFENAPKMKRSVKEFGVIVADLRNCLRAVNSACGHLHVASVGAEALKCIRLEINILELFSIAATLRTFTPVPCNTEISDDYKKAADEFVKMKSDLRTFCIQEGAQNRLITRNHFSGSDWILVDIIKHDECR